MHLESNSQLHPNGIYVLAVLDSVYLLNDDKLPFDINKSDIGKAKLDCQTI
jgi:hypothetical protein